MTKEAFVKSTLLKKEQLKIPMVVMQKRKKKSKKNIHTSLLTIIDSCTIFSQAECVSI